MQGYLNPGAIWLLITAIVSGGFIGFVKLFGGQIKSWFEKKRPVSATPPDKS